MNFYQEIRAENLDDDAIKSLLEPIDDALQGGKKFRQKLYLLILSCFKNPEQYHKYSLIPEIIHNGTLIIDDIEDNSKTRRNKPCAHIKYGLDTAINSGNAMYFLPYLIIKHEPQEFKAIIYELINKTLLQLHIGQATDIYWHNTQKHITKKQYLQMCRMKTGMLTGMSAALAAISAQKPPETFEKFGQAIGIAFQIQDDILNLTGGKNWTKDYGDDIQEGKMTLPVILALEKLSKKEAQKLKEILSKHTTDQNMTKEAITLIQNTGAITESKKEAEKILNHAWHNIEPELPHTKSKQELKQLVDSFIERDY